MALRPNERIAAIVRGVERPHGNKVPLCLHEHGAGRIANERFHTEHVTPLPGDPAADFEILTERNRLAKADVDARRYSAVTGVTRCMRHRFVKQRHCDAAVCDVAPALKLFCKRHMRKHAVVTRLEMQP